MNSKERLQATIKRLETDRAPHHFRAEPETLEKLYNHLGNRDYESLLVRFNSDIRYIDAVYPPDRKCDGFYQNCWGERHVFKPSQYGPVRELIDGALTDVKSLDDIKNFRFPRVDDLDYSGISAYCDKHADKGITYALADFWTRPSNVRGMENFLLDMSLHPEYCHYFADYFSNFYVEDFRRAYKASHGQIDLFLTYSDLGTQFSPLISIRSFREFIKPYLKRIADAVHDLGAALFYHSCGMCYPFIEDLIDAGVDVLDPIQPCTKEMQPENLAEKFGDRLAFHGGIDVQRVLANGTPDEVRAEVARYKKAFNNRGYIVSSSHMLQMDTDVENIFALFNTTPE